MTEHPEERTAIVTGAGRGIGAAIAADVGDEQAVDACESEVAATLGAPTVLVNNAGGLRDPVAMELGRLGVTANAEAVSFFCSPGAGFTSGQVLYVAGGPATDSPLSSVSDASSGRRSAPHFPRRPPSPSCRHVSP